MKYDLETFKTFEGKLISGVYEFPELLAKNLRGITSWKISIILSGDSDIPITEACFETVPAGIVAKIITRQRINDGPEFLTDPIVIAKGMAQGKKNARNVFTQALIEARSKWLKKLSAGYYLKQASESPAENSSKFYFAMAAHPWTEKDQEKFGYPCYLQPKLDGVRCLACYNSRVYLLSREHKEWIGFTEIESVLEKLFRLPGYKNLYLDGELYLHGENLQTIISAARRRINDKNIVLQYHIFDAFINPTTKFSDRLGLLDEIFRVLPDLAGEHAGLFCRVRTVSAGNQDDINQEFKRARNAGYEGLMIRNPAGIYETSVYGEKRSHSILKLKKRQDAEFKFVGLETGQKGRSVGEFIGVFETPGGGVFKAMAKGMTLAESKKLYLLVSENLEDYIGKLATIEFETLSETGIPLKPKFVIFRDQL